MPFMDDSEKTFSFSIPFYLEKRQFILTFALYNLDLNFHEKIRI